MCEAQKLKQRIWAENGFGTLDGHQEIESPGNDGGVERGFSAGTAAGLRLAGQLKFLCDI